MASTSYWLLSIHAVLRLSSSLLPGEAYFLYMASTSGSLLSIHCVLSLSSLRPAARSLVPPWDLTLVLDALVREPFEPLETVQLKFLLLKTALLVALSTAKRASDIHALSVNESCMRFSGNGTRVTVRPNLSFLPKTFPSGCDPVELVAFHPPPFASEDYMASTSGSLLSIRCVLSLSSRFLHGETLSLSALGVSTLFLDG